MARRYAIIEQYREKRRQLAERGGSINETNLRSAFQNCLSAYCQREKLELIPELPLSNGLRPDGTLRDQMRLNYGYWEAKDTKDDLHREIERKTKRGYPTDNILYEDGNTAFLMQNGRPVMEIEMANNAALDRIIRTFLSHQPEPVADFNRAIIKFQSDLPALLQALRDMIQDAHAANAKYREAEETFLRLCKQTINPSIVVADVREMLIQHILTRDIFWRVFNDEDFHKQNNIARQLEELQNTFITREKRKDLLSRILHYYAAIQKTASQIANHGEKQHFLRGVYESFYRAYNPKAADRLGVFYTPEEIVSFMVRAADELTHKHFNRRLYDKNVQILDPATGTGTFIAELISFFPKGNLRHKFDNELHANELAILPYYIANLNIEHTYKEKLGSYREFPNACFVDTLDNVGHIGQRGQGLLGGLSRENIRRIRQQNEKEISVIIGNPPYNANQLNENENNKNRKYPAVDKQIKDTYLHASTAQKTKLYDMYVRFVRWASDRLGDDGVLAFVTNSSFIDARGFDGFRKVVAEEFNELRIIDLKGRSRDVSREEQKAQGGNVFGVRVGIAVWFFVKNKARKGADIHYHECAPEMFARDKLDFLKQARDLSDIDFSHIIPDNRHNWIRQTSNDFDSLLCVADKAAKTNAANGKETSVFKKYSLGVSTNRDDWAYGMDTKSVTKKVRYFISEYEAARAEFAGKEFTQDDLGSEIKWSRDLKNCLKANMRARYRASCIRPVMYRPFAKKQLYLDHIVDDVISGNFNLFPRGEPGTNKTICFAVSSGHFCALAADAVADLHFTGSSQCLPLYHYTPEGERVSNITKWGLQKFRAHYKNKKISAEDVFHYTYAVLHNPAYLNKYRLNIMRDFPRLPFYANFRKWVNWGKKLMDLHIGYASQKPAMRRVDTKAAAGSPKLKANKKDGKIVIDEKTTLTDIPPAAWDYKLGSRSALEWVLDQHKEKKIRDDTVRVKFNTYKFADHKESAIDLLRRVCTVSTETMKIIAEMEKEKMSSPQNRE